MPRLGVSPGGASTRFGLSRPIRTPHDRAFADHGEVEVTLGAAGDASRAVLRTAAEEGVDLEAITTRLEQEGVAGFCDSYRGLPRCIGSRLGSLSGVA